MAAFNLTLCFTDLQHCDLSFILKTVDLAAEPQGHNDQMWTTHVRTAFTLHGRDSRVSRIDRYSAPVFRHNGVGSSSEVGSLSSVRASLYLKKNAGGLITVYKTFGRLIVGI